MTMTPEQQKSIIAKESAWIDADQFAPLDLSAFPALQPPPAPEVHDNRWAKDWRDTALSASAAELRKFVLDPDTETLERVGNEIGHEGLRDEVRQQEVVVDARAPVHQATFVRHLPERGDRGAHQQHLRRRHPRMRRHLKRSAFHQPAPAGGTVGRVHLVDAELGAMGVAGHIGEDISK